MAELWIPGRPVPAARARVVNGHAYTPQRYREWKSEAAFRLRSQTDARFDGPVSVTVVVGADGIGVTVEPVEGSRPKGVRGDLDNIAGKSVLDALQDAGVLVNDSLVHRLVASFR